MAFKPSYYEGKVLLCELSKPIGILLIECSNSELFQTEKSLEGITKVIKSLGNWVEVVHRRVNRPGPE